MPARPAGARLAGLSVPDGIVLVGRSAWGAAQALPDGTLRTFAGRLADPPRWARLPLVRAWTGLLRQALATKGALAAMRGRPAPRRWVGALVLVGVQALLGFAAIRLGVLAAQESQERTGEPLWAIPAVAGALSLYMLLAVALGSRHPRLRAMYRLHAAEHRVIHALEMDDALPAAWRERHATCPKEHPRCGTGWTYLLVVLPFALAASLWSAAPAAATHPAATLAWIALGPPLLSELSAWRPAQAVLAAPGLVLQRFTTQAPGPREAEVAVAAADALLAAARGTEA